MKQHREPEKILDHRMIMQASGFITQYQVKWKGLSINQSTWKTQLDLKDNQTLIQSYKRSQTNINNGETLIEQRPKKKQTTQANLFKVHNNRTKTMTNNEDFFFEDESNEMKEDKSEPHLQINFTPKSKSQETVIQTNLENQIEPKQKMSKTKSKKQVKSLKSINESENDQIPNKTSLSYFLTKAAQINEYYNYNEYEQISYKDKIIRANTSSTVWRNNQEPQLRKIIRTKDGNQKTVTNNYNSFQSSNQKINSTHNTKENLPNYDMLIQNHQNSTNCQIISVHARSKTEGPVWYIIKEDHRYHEVSEEQLLQSNPIIIQEFINKKENKAH